MGSLVLFHFRFSGFTIGFFLTYIYIFKLEIEEQCLDHVSQILFFQNQQQQKKKIFFPLRFLVSFFLLFFIFF